MLRRPFKTEAHRELLPFDGDLQVILRLRVGAPPSEAMLSDLDRPFRNLEVAAQWGAMAGDTAEPQSSSMTLRISALPIDRNAVVWTFTAINIHRGAFRVIENLVHWLHLNVAAIDTLEMHSALLTPGSGVPDELPQDHEPHPFEFEYGVEGTDVLVDVDLAARIDPQHLGPFRAAWLGWEGLAVQGGFSDETYPPRESHLCVEDELRLTSTGLSASYEQVAIADAGFMCLANMLQTFHHRVAAVEAVVIE